MDDCAMSANQSAVVHIRGHDFTVTFTPKDDELPELIRLGLGEYPDVDKFSEAYIEHGNDKHRARRYASVRAAADIGKVMP